MYPSIFRFPFFFKGDSDPYLSCNHWHLCKSTLWRYWEMLISADLFLNLPNYWYRCKIRCKRKPGDIHHSQWIQSAGGVCLEKKVHAVWMFAVWIIRAELQLSNISGHHIQMGYQENTYNQITSVNINIMLMVPVSVSPSQSPPCDFWWWNVKITQGDTYPLAFLSIQLSLLIPEYCSHFSPLLLPVKWLLQAFFPHNISRRCFWLFQMTQVQKQRAIIILVFLFSFFFLYKKPRWDEGCENGLRNFLPSQTRAFTWNEQKLVTRVVSYFCIQGPWGSVYVGRLKPIYSVKLNEILD